MIDLLIFILMVLKDGASMISIIEIMISLLIFVMMVIKNGTNMVSFIEIMISLLEFGQMEGGNIGLMGRELNEYL
jgi:hypothetical protein